MQKHVTLSAQTAAGSLWDLSAFIAAGILRAFALKLKLAFGFLYFFDVPFAGGVALVYVYAIALKCNGNVSDGFAFRAS